MTSFNTDRSFFQVVCLYRTGYGLGTDSILDRSEVIEWIVTGQFTDIVRIFEFNPSESFARDVTEEIMSEANDRREAMGRQMLEVA